MTLALAGCGGVFDETKAFHFLDEVREKGAEIEDKSFQAGAEALDRYCLTVPDGVRMYARNSLNSRAQVARIEVTCGDGS